jgi:hypothetical protein
MSQTQSFELTPKEDLLEHLDQIYTLYINKLDELFVLGAQIQTLTAVIGDYAVKGVALEPEVADPIQLSAVA